MPRRFPGLLAVLAVLFTWISVSSAEAAEGGRVTRLQGTAQAQRAAGLIALAPNGLVYKGDTLKTEPDARLEVTFTDGTVITLGEKAEFVIDDYLFQNDPPAGNAAFRLAQGAFLAVTGRIGKLTGRPFAVRTPIATIGIRGTTFWGGPSQGEFGVLLLEGAGVIVQNEQGRVELTQPGLGTAIRSGKAPDDASAWSAERTAQAVATVTFREAKPR